MRAHSLLVIAVLTGAAVSGAAGCGNAAKPFPSYANDVKPIMDAHCIRCHGAGGMMNGDPYTPLIMNTQTPIRGDFTTMDGFKTYTGPGGGSLKVFIDTLPMPPPPSSKLDSFDYDTLVNWASNPAP
jgi:hypothetical protein